MWDSVLLIICGVLLIAGGFWGGLKFHFPYGALVSWSAPVGLLITLVGIVTLLIPNFFR